MGNNSMAVVIESMKNLNSQKEVPQEGWVLDVSKNLDTMTTPVHATNEFNGMGDKRVQVILRR